MGVLYDYFRAADASTVAVYMEASRGGSPVTSRAVDGVDAKGIEPVVTVGKLVASILDVPWHPGLVDTDEIWPMDNDEDGEGPVVLSLADDVRDVLAGIDDPRLPQLATRWSQIDEVARSDPDFIRSVLTDLVGLARRAATAGDHLYCWVSL